MKDLFVYFIIIQVFLIISIYTKNETPAIVPKYNLIEKCYRSSLGIAAKANYTSLISCQRLGLEKKGLALNFSPQSAFNYSHPLEYTCEILKCAEVEGGLSLNRDSRYDYYSIYGKPLPNVNSTCVPATGMFFLTQKTFNYTEAERNCKNVSGILADITSEQRTDSFAQILASSGVKSAYVGMWRHNDSIYHTSSDSTLDCTTYRAWAPGHPRHFPNSSCVILTRQRTWKTTPCKNRLPALCELIPGGPYKKGSIFPSKTRNGKSDVMVMDLTRNTTLSFI